MTKLLLLIALGVAVLTSGCADSGTLQGTPGMPSLSEAQRPDAITGAIGARDLLYVLVNNGDSASYVGLYDAYAKNPQLLGKITDGVANPGAIWTDARGDIFVGNDMTYTSSVTEYAVKTHKLIRTYTSGIDLPFGGFVDPQGRMYVSVAGVTSRRLDGGIQVFSAHAKTPSSTLIDNVVVPHGLAKDTDGNLFLAQIFGQESSVLEFPSGSSKSKVLPLDDLDTGAFLEDLVLDAHGDIVVADAKLNAVRFYPPPYKKESLALTSGMSAPTGLAYGPDGSLFVGNEYAGNNGNVVIFAPGASTPSRTIATGIVGGVLGVAVGPAR